MRLIPSSSVFSFLLHAGISFFIVYVIHMNAVVSCGGTGGHVFPGLATAAELCDRGCSVTIIGTGRDVESESLKEWTGAVENTGLAGYTKGGACKRVVLLASSFFKSSGILRRIRPDVLLAMGGYASFGPVLAARLLSIPVVLHEGNAVPGRALKLLASFADQIAVNYKITVGLIRHNRVTATGFPVRRSLMESAIAAHQHANSDLFCILVLGGSQGAQALNEIVPEAVRVLDQEGARIRVLHIAGERDRDKVLSRYSELNVEVEVFGFVHEMRELYSRADAAISRAGASALAELAVYGIPSLLVPFPYASDNHQRANAMHYSEGGGVEVVDQSEFSPARCRRFIEVLIESGSTCKSMRDGMLACARTGAASDLADVVENSAKEQKNADI